MATALALVAMNQVEPEQELKRKRAPGNLQEVLQFERQTGKLYRKSRDIFPEEEQNPLGRDDRSAPLSAITR